MRNKRKKLLAIASVCAVTSVGGVAHAAEPGDEVDGKPLIKIDYEVPKHQKAEIKKFGIKRKTDKGEVLKCSIVGNTKAPPREETCMDHDGSFFHLALDDDDQGV